MEKGQGEEGLRREKKVCMQSVRAIKVYPELSCMSSDRPRAQCLIIRSGPRFHLAQEGPHVYVNECITEANCQSPEIPLLANKL